MNQQREIKHQQEVIDKLKSFNREKSIKRAESREKMLEKMEVLDRPDTEVQELKLYIWNRAICPSGNDVLTCRRSCEIISRDQHALYGSGF